MLLYTPTNCLIIAFYYKRNNWCLNTFFLSIPVSSETKSLDRQGVGTCGIRPVKLNPT